MTSSLSPEQIAAARDLLERAGFKVLDPFRSVESYAAPVDVPLKVIMAVDVETTGLDPVVDVPIELGYVMAEYDPDTGRVHRILDRYSGFEDPNVPLSAKIQRLTGLTDADVQGQRFDDGKVNADVARSDFVVAHNAGFDRFMCEKRFPAFADKPWGCSWQEGPWEAMGITTGKLEFLAFKVCGIHYHAHRALVDAEVLLHVLTAPGLEGRPCLAHVLEQARRATYTVWANGSDYSTKDTLAAAGYRWSGEGGSGKIPKTWHKTGVVDLEAELQFLATSIYRHPAQVTVDEIDALSRYSSRTDGRHKQALPTVDRAEISKPTPVLAAGPAAVEPAPAMRRSGFGARR